MSSRQRNQKNCYCDLRQYGLISLAIFEFSASLHFFISQRRMLLVLNASLNIRGGNKTCFPVDFSLYRRNLNAVHLLFILALLYQIISKSLLQYCIFSGFFLTWRRKKVKTCEKKMHCEN